MNRVQVGEFYRIRWTSTIGETLEGGSGRVLVLRADGKHDTFDIGCFSCYPSTGRCVGR